MSMLEKKRVNADLRRKRTRAKIHGTAVRPRLSVKISNLHVTAQAIDDDKRVTLAYATTVGKKVAGNKSEKAALVGAEIGKKIRKLKIDAVVLDRNSRKYAKRLMAFADAARKEGLEF